MTEPAIDLEIECPDWLAALDNIEALVSAAAAKALTAPRPSKGNAASVVILLTDDDDIKGLNAQFRGKDSATNVLSFPALLNAQGHLGDIALAFDTCVREAAEQGKALADHVQHLTVHGVLHLLGYDHENEAEAEIMEALERALLADLGISDPYVIKADGALAQHHV